MRREQRREVLAVHVFHGDERRAFDFADVVHAADVGMRDLAGDADFAVEARRGGAGSRRRARAGTSSATDWPSVRSVAR